jgi:hypothetical protein
MRGVKLVSFKADDWRGPGLAEVKLACRSLTVDPISFFEGEIAVGLQYELSDFTPVLRIRSIADAVIDANVELMQRRAKDDPSLDPTLAALDATQLVDAAIAWLLREAVKLQQTRADLVAAEYRWAQERTAAPTVGAA